MATNFLKPVEDAFRGQESTAPKAAPAASTAAAIEDEDALLYGDAAPAAAPEPARDHTSTNPRSWWRKHLQNARKTFWAILLRENGTLEILSLPDFTLKFSIFNFPLGADVLIDASVPTAGSKPVDASSLDSHPSVSEVLLVGLGSEGKRPLLLARTTDHELLAYEAFPYYGKLETQQLKLRFKKIKHGLILRERKGK